MFFNPLDLRGPEFLLFYTIYGLVVVGLVRLWINWIETRYPVPKLKQDAYEIAYLRGGRNEAIEVAIFSLLDRGLLQTHKGQLKTKNPEAIKLARKPIEKAILNRFVMSGVHDDAFEINPLTDYEISLARNKLIVDKEAFNARLIPLLVGILLVVGLGLWKVIIAVSRGRHNVLFLFLLIGAFCFWFYRIAKRERTSLGDIVLDDLRGLFERLLERRGSVPVGGATNEAVLLAAVYGMTALTVERFPFMRELPSHTPMASSTCSSGFSCSTSSCSSSSCSSGCGGGGGCGGCGS